MATPLELLDQLITAQPVALQPVLNQIGSMLKSSQVAFDSHIADNDSLFGQMSTMSQSLATRISELEKKNESFAKDGTTLEARVAAIEARVTATESLTTSLESRAGDVVRDGAKAVEDLKTIYAKIDIVHGVVNDLAGGVANLSAQSSDMKGLADSLELRASQAEIKIDGMTNECQGFMTKLLEHDKAIKDMPDKVPGVGDGGHATNKNDWAGVAGSRLFTSRVKEYSGPSSSFQSWAKNFKSNVPKEMRDSLDWAERLTVPITDDLINDKKYEQWDEETWRCLAGVLRGQWETLKDTLKSGQGLELWRQLVGGHVIRSPDHADSIHQALHKVEPAKDLNEVRHKIHQVKAGIIRHDELASEPMQDGSKRSLYMRILPKEVAKHLAMQARPNTVEELLDRVMKYIVDMGGFEATMGLTPVQMDLGAVMPDNEQAKELAAMRADLRALGAMIGKGGRQEGKGPGKGAWGNYKGPRTEGGKGGKPTGGDKGGKGRPGRPPMQSPAAEARRGARICHQFQETGRCWYLDNNGYCKFKHVKGLPNSLNNVEGLRFEDLAGNLKYDKESQVYHYTANATNDQAILEEVNAEIAAIAADMEELEQLEAEQQQEGEPSSQPFQRR